MRRQQGLTTFAARVSLALKATGRQWPDLTAHMKLTRAAIKKWRDGPTVPTADNVLKAADWLGVNFRWLLQGIGTMKIETAVTDAEAQLLAAFRQLQPADQQSVAEHATSLLYRRTGHTGPGKPFRSPPK